MVGIELDGSLAARLAEVNSQVVTNRRYFHQHAELGWCEFATTAYVLEQLRQLPVDLLVWGPELLPGIERLGVPKDEVQLIAAQRARAWGGNSHEIETMLTSTTGVVAELRGATDGPLVALRVDMDGLPIGESEDTHHVPRARGFASEAPGVMHACGHDGHLAIGLAVMQALAPLRDELAGRFRLIFQPAEEGTRGGVAFVDAGWLRDVDYLLTFHISGYEGLYTGAYSPGVDELLSTIKFDVSLHGRAAHYASAPHKGRSALIAGSAIALLSQALPRKPGARALINVGRLEAGTARNVVPEHGELQMEVRAETDELVNDLFAQVNQLAQGIAAGLEVETTTRVVGRTPAADSDAELASVIAGVGDGMGLSRVDGLKMEASDDASAMMRAVQDTGRMAIYAKVGSDLADGNHTSAYDFDERSLAIGVELMARAALACMTLKR